MLESITNASSDNNLAKTRLKISPLRLIPLNNVLFKVFGNKIFLAG